MPWLLCVHKAKLSLSPSRTFPSFQMKTLLVFVKTPLFLSLPSVFSQSPLLCLLPVLDNLWKWNFSVCAFLTFVIVLWGSSVLQLNRRKTMKRRAWLLLRGWDFHYRFNGENGQKQRCGGSPEWAWPGCARSREEKWGWRAEEEQQPRQWTGLLGQETGVAKMTSIIKGPEELREGAAQPLGWRIQGMGLRMPARRTL